MSHFIEICDIVRHELFCFGKSIGPSHETFELARMAACNEMLFEEFLSAFPERNYKLDPVGARALYAWMKGQPESHFVFYCDANDGPMQEGVDRYWPYRGSIHTDTAVSIFGYVGYLHLFDFMDPKWDGLRKIACAGGGIQANELEAIKKYLMTHRLPPKHIEGLPV